MHYSVELIQIVRLWWRFDEFKTGSQ
jgi:hypothetical protein